MKKIKELKVYAGMLALAASTLAGCANNKKNTVSQEPTKIVTEVTVTPTNTVTPTPVIEETKTVTEPYFEVSAMGSLEHAEFDKIISLSEDDSKYFISNKSIYSGLIGYDVKCNENAFAQLMKKTDSNYTKYYDIYLAIRNNINLDDNAKNILIEAVHNLEQNAKSYEPTVDNYPNTLLEYNLRDLKILYYNDPSGDWTVLFNAYKKQLVINTAVVTTDYQLKVAIIRGGIGYGSIKGFEVINGTKALVSASEYCFQNGAVMSNQKKIVALGEAFEDALAEIITHIAMKTPISPINSEHYNEVVLFNMYLNSGEMTPTEYAQFGYAELASRVPMPTLMKEIDTIVDSNYDTAVIEVSENDSFKITEPEFIHAISFIDLTADCIYRKMENMEVTDKKEYMKAELRAICAPVTGSVDIIDYFDRDCLDYDSRPLSSLKPALDLGFLRHYIDKYVDKYFEDMKKPKEKTINGD